MAEIFQDSNRRNNRVERQNNDVAGATHIIHTMRQEYATRRALFVVRDDSTGRQNGRQKAMKNQEGGLMQEKRRFSKFSQSD